MKNKEGKLKTVTLNIEGMSCGHCVQTVQKALEAVDNISGVTVDLDGKKAEFTTDDDSAVQKAVDEVNKAGYKAEQSLTRS